MGKHARVVVAHPEDALIREVEVGDMTWIRKPEETDSITAKVRYQMRPAACHIQFDGDQIRLLFDELHRSRPLRGRWQLFMPEMNCSVAASSIKFAGSSILMFASYDSFICNAALVFATVQSFAH